MSHAKGMEAGTQSKVKEKTAQGGKGSEEM